MSYNAKSEEKLLQANIKINKLKSEIENANKVYSEIVGHLQTQREHIQKLERHIATGSNALEAARDDLKHFGQGFVKLSGDGSFTRIDPREVYLMGDK